ncbi:MAG TPA: chromosome partition protein MukE [Polyangiaceae bacterium]|jgi:chromosome partition protein MukE|nr:chromosome partition protein MukE [Polyangiaceae bacterium]
MSTTRFERLEDVILEAVFPDVDLALRRGKHIGADDLAFYTFLVDARELLEPLYRRYGCELVYKADGYFYLLPTSEKLGRRHLRPTEMLVGQALALLYLDPRTVEQGGVVGRDEVLGQLATVLGTDDLVRAFNPQKKRLDERVAEEGVRTKVTEAVRRLAALGFVALADDGRTKLRPALLRFAEPARLAEPPEVVLARLASEGEVVLTDDEEVPPDEDAALGEELESPHGQGDDPEDGDDDDASGDPEEPEPAP